MLKRVQYSGELVEIEICGRPIEGLADIWLRGNEQTETDSAGDLIQTADEVYICLPASEAPTDAQIKEDFAGWWNRAGEWRAENAIPMPTLEERLTAVEAATLDLIFGGVF